MYKWQKEFELDRRVFVASIMKEFHLSTSTFDDRLKLQVTFQFLHAKGIGTNWFQFRDHKFGQYSAELGKISHEMDGIELQSQPGFSEEEKEKIQEVKKFLDQAKASPKILTAMKELERYKAALR